MAKGQRERLPFMSSSRVRPILSWVLVLLLAVMFGMAGLAKLGGNMNEMFANWGYPAWFATFIGAAELAGAIGLLIPRTMRWAVYGLTLIMIGGAYTHLSNGEGAEVLRPLAFAAVMWTALALRGRTAAGD